MRALHMPELTEEQQTRLAEVYRTTIPRDAQRDALFC
jgi:hypothetical protein